MTELTDEVLKAFNRQWDRFIDERSREYDKAHPSPIYRWFNKPAYLDPTSHENHVDRLKAEMFFLLGYKQARDNPQ